MAFLLQHLLNESACRKPDAVALRHEGRSLTYAELEGDSNRVARALNDLRVKRGDRVGIYVEKSFASIVAIFGILKAGAAYVPLDPGAPASRIAYIARNCDIQVVLTSPAKLKGLAEALTEATPIHSAILMGSSENATEAGVQLSEGFNLVDPESLKSQISDALNTPEPIDTDLAYILYTSGSTGEPKGVMISHRTIFTFINWCSDLFEISETDRVTSHAPIHFDLSTFDIFVTIKAGGTVVLVPDKTSIFPIQLTRLLQDEAVSVLYMVPSILSTMIAYGNVGGHDLSSLRLVLFAGEVFPIKYLRRWMEEAPQAAFYNLYGPTETNVCTYYRVLPEDVAAEKTSPAPIGIACQNMEVFAVDEGGGIVSQPGVEGELWVRGSGVALGYWGDQAKTASAFVQDPRHQDFSDTAYRTGDIVKLAEDGENWIYIGRRDHMIKSRGYRIELGEIETALYAHGGVREAAVVPVTDEFVGNRLLALVVPTSSNGLTVSDLERHCRKRLPAYMVPESIEFTASLPKTATGKVNRVELASRFGRDRSSTAGRNPST
jgi:amino acid adenylation domain-containing protein